MNVGIETLRNFNVRAKVVGPSGLFVKYIQQETGTRVQIKGQGSGFVDAETGRESDEPMHIHITYEIGFFLILDVVSNIDPGDLMNNKLCEQNH